MVLAAAAGDHQGPFLADHTVDLPAGDGEYLAFLDLDGYLRKTLETLLLEGPGWDVLHFSGHGLASQLVLEKEDGTPDFVAAAELLKLLKPARGRLKWITLSACLSAAATIDETLRWLGLEPKRGGAEGPRGRESFSDADSADRMWFDRKKLPTSSRPMPKLLGDAQAERR